MLVTTTVSPGYQWNVASVEYPLALSSTNYVRPSSLAKGAQGTTLMNFMVKNRGKPGVVQKGLSPNLSHITLRYGLNLQMKEPVETFNSVDPLKLPESVIL